MSNLDKVKIFDRLSTKLEVMRLVDKSSNNILRPHISELEALIDKLKQSVFEPS